ncbi:hypothetical protein N7G274_002189 [Stereocaulon virgatum]|uniref:methylated diphthine methylhydrolase n=1 Tax=Stereocaulon virgatum TaxID=373712 RepID=A0ABR4AQN0_9LECA
MSSASETNTESVQPWPVDVGEATTSITSIILDSQPSCLEFCLSNTEYFVLGTYVLEVDEKPKDSTAEIPKDDVILKKPQKRSGSLKLFRLEKYCLSCLQTITTPFAILDIHFLSVQKTTLVVATSEGSVQIYRLDLEKWGDKVTLIKESVVQLFDPSILVLSLACYPSFGSSLGGSPSLIAVSASDGQVLIFDHMRYITADRAKILGRSQAHSLEAWTVVWASSSRVTDEMFVPLYSGGDDSALCRHRSTAHALGTVGDHNDEIQHLQDPVRCDRNTHSAGVTAILPLLANWSKKDEFLLTGSYDEYVRVLVLPASGGRAQLLAKKCLGGGVWRLKLVDRVSSIREGTYFLILASCMHAGAKFLKVQSSNDHTNWSIKILTKFEEHKSMNYASDGRVESIDEFHSVGYTFVSTSFYDRKLCVWHTEHREGMMRLNPIRT